MGNSGRFSEVDLRAHRAFWQSGNRITKLREAANAVIATLGTSDADLAYRAGVVLGGADVPVAKSFGRFLGGSDLGNKPWAVTALCWAMCRLCEEQVDKLSSQTGTCSSLAGLLEDSKAQFPGFPPPPVTAGRADAHIGRDALQRILELIETPKWESDPRYPEFPPSSPKYPATPMIPIAVGEHDIQLKDESYNPTGSHKDRWAWEQLLGYKRILQLRLDQMPQARGRVTIPSLCMISAGGAAYALQNLLRLRGLPPLHVVIDEERVGRRVTDRLRSVGAVVHPNDLDRREFDEEMVRIATGLGANGIDITTRKLITPGGVGFYDWLVCEVLLSRPSHIFVPYGSGDLYTNIMAFLEKESESKLSDPRLYDVRKDELRGIHLIGATTNDIETKMNKLFAKYRPTWTPIQSKIVELKKSGVLGSSSAVLEVTDNCAEAALTLGWSKGIRSELSGIAALGLFLERAQELQVTSSSNVVVVNTGWLYIGH